MSTEIVILRKGKTFSQTLNQKTYVEVYHSKHPPGTTASEIMAESGVPSFGSYLGEDASCFVTNRQLDMSDGSINADITITYSNTYGAGGGGGNQPVLANDTNPTFAWSATKEQVEISRFTNGKLIMNSANQQITGVTGYDRFTTLKVSKIYDSLTLSSLVLKAGQINSDTFTVDGYTAMAGEALFDGFSTTELVNTGSGGNRIQAEFNFIFHPTVSIAAADESYWNVPVTNAGDFQLVDDELVKIVDATGNSVHAFLDIDGKAILPPPSSPDSPDIISIADGDRVDSFSFGGVFDFMS